MKEFKKLLSKFKSLKKAFYFAIKPSNLNQFGSSDLSRGRAKSASSPFSPLQINVMRGFFILLLVTYHIVGSDENSGLKISNGWLRTISNCLDFLRMPLITAIGGLVYAIKPASGASDGFSIFIEKKVRRLLVPMLMVGTIFAFIHNMTEGANQVPINLATLHFIPVAHYWYLESLFWIYISVFVFEKLRLLSSPIRFLALMIGIVTLHLSTTLPVTLGIGGWLYLLPYFIFGIALAKFGVLRSLYQNPKFLVILLGVVIVGLIINGVPENYVSRNTVPFLVIGCSLICIVFGLIPKVSSRILGRIGQSAYAIYLFHIFFTAATRISLKFVGLPAHDYLWINLIVALIASVIGSWLIEKLARKHPLSSLLFLGEGKLFRLPRKH